MHTPVMLAEVLAALNIQPGHWLLDGTFGAGGHSSAMAQVLKGKGRFFGADRDPETRSTMEAFAKRWAPLPCHWAVTPFSGWAQLWAQHPEVQEHGLQGALLDLGLSSMQLDQPSRGMSFLREGPLDMRMSAGEGQSAAEWLAEVSGERLETVLRCYGEEPQAASLARAIVAQRRRYPLRTTRDLAELVVSIKGRGSGRRHPATRTFQAIRLVVNQELQELESALQQLVHLLAPHGRLVILTFQGLEVRSLRYFLRSSSARSQRQGQTFRLHFLSKQAPHLSEVRLNPRSRSAWMWVLSLEPDFGEA